MTITVKLPDGTTVGFPDGTSRDVMKSAVQRHLAKTAAPAAPVAPSQPNPDGTYGQVPEGMVFNPSTGQYTSRELLANHAVQTGQVGTGMAATAGGAQGMMFGTSDEALGGINALIPGAGTMRERYDFGREASRAQLDAAREAHPVAAYGGEIAGGIASGLATGGAGMAAGKSLGIGGTTLAGKAAIGAATGAAEGGLYGFGAGEGGLADRGTSAAKGAVVGGVLGGTLAPLMGAGSQSIADRFARGKAIKQAAKGAPTTDALRAEGRAAYKAVDDAGVGIKPEAFTDWRKGLMDALRGRGLDELPIWGPGSLTPMSARASQIAGEMDRAMATDPTAALPFRALDQLRRHAGTASGNMANKTDSAVGSEMISQLDDFVNRLGPDDIAYGDVETLKTMLPKAREVWSRMSRSQTIDDAIEASGNYLSGDASGLRNQFSRILKNPKLSRGFSDAEKAMLRRVVNGSGMEKIAHLLGGGLGRLGQMGAGFGAGGPVGAIAGAATGSVARRISDGLASRGAETVRAVIANGGMPTSPKGSDIYRMLTEAMTRATGRVAGQ